MITLNWMRVIALAIAYLALTAVASAADGTTGGKYRPVFEVKLSQDAGALVASYLRAYRSPTPEVAVKRWEKFLKEYADSESIEDMTDLTLLRQGHLELMRLYYQKGRIEEADQLLKKANDYATYSVPEPPDGQRWCKVNKYCE
jgi:tetratricopeptide (TPR) repeat protein